MPFALGGTLERPSPSIHEFEDEFIETSAERLDMSQSKPSWLSAALGHEIEAEWLRPNRVSRIP